MARATQRKASARKSRGSKERSYQNYRDTLLEWSERPAVRYMAGGIGLALLARFAYTLSDRYPEIGRFVRDNIETVEDKLREFRGLDQERTHARH